MNAPSLALVQPSRSLTAADVRAHVNLIQEVMLAVMKRDVHYGVIPGCKQPSLYKAGSEVLLSTFRIAVSVQVDDLSTEDMIRYRVRTVGTHQGSGVVVGEGIGECSSNEEKYKWRKAYQAEYDATSDNRRRKKFCKDYTVLQVRTDPADVANTVLKMAKKRAQIDLTLTATAASDIFTQDIEDMPEELRSEEGSRSAPASAAVAKSQPVDSEARHALIAKLLPAAQVGTFAYAEAFTALSKEERVMVGTDEHNRLKALAASVDAAKEVPTENTNAG